jgi:hypothetical protein
VLVSFAIKLIGRVAGPFCVSFTRENVEACETLAVRATRPPIVKLDFAAAARAVGPAKAVGAVPVERAEKAQNIVRTFKQTIWNQGMHLSKRRPVFIAQQWNGPERGAEGYFEVI